MMYLSFQSLKFSIKETWIIREDLIHNIPIVRALVAVPCFISSLHLAGLTALIWAHSFSCGGGVAQLIHLFQYILICLVALSVSLWCAVLKKCSADCQLYCLLLLSQSISFHSLNSISSIWVSLCLSQWEERCRLDLELSTFSGYKSLLL